MVSTHEGIRRRCQPSNTFKVNFIILKMQESLFIFDLKSEVLALRQPRLGHDWLRFANAVIQLKDKITPNELVMVDNLQFMGHIDYIISYINQFDKRY
jgi:hypothetical protein